MSEPNAAVPDEVADVDVEESSAEESEDEAQSTEESEDEAQSTEGSEIEEESTDGHPATVELDIDQEKIEAWDEVKSDYAMESEGEPAPNSKDAKDRGTVDSPEAQAPSTHS